MNFDFKNLLSSSEKVLIFFPKKLDKGKFWYFNFKNLLSNLKKFRYIFSKIYILEFNESNIWEVGDSLIMWFIGERYGFIGERKIGKSFLFFNILYVILKLFPYLRFRILKDFFLVYNISNSRTLMKWIKMFKKKIDYKNLLSNLKEF